MYQCLPTRLLRGVKAILSFWMADYARTGTPDHTDVCVNVHLGSYDTVTMRWFMANAFGTDILIQARDAMTAARFYVEYLGFEITDNNPKMIGLHGQHINLFIEPGPPLGPVLEVTVDNVQKARATLVQNGCEVIKEEPEFPRCYIRDPWGLIYNLIS
jgi:hypothetical protein